MRLTPPQPPQDDEFAALRHGLNGFNEAITGPLLRERIASFIKDAEGCVRGGGSNWDTHLFDSSLTGKVRNTIFAGDLRSLRHR